MRARLSPSTRTARPRSSKSPTSAWWGTFSRSSPRSSGCCRLELAQDVFGRGHLELPRGFDVDVRGHAIARNDREALAPRTHALALGVEVQSERSGVLAVTVREHQDPVADARGLDPGGHDKHVVDGHAGDGVDAPGTDLIGQLHEPGQVLRVAGRG